jgi:hypothetical protein
MRVIADNVPHGGTIHGIRPGGSRVLLPAVSHDHAKKSQGLLDLGPAHSWRTPALHKMNCSGDYTHASH